MKTILVLLSLLFVVSFMSCGPTRIVAARPEPVMYTRPLAPGEGYIWMGGDWYWTGGRYTWHEGRWERPRTGRAWQEGNWSQTRRGYRWNRGHWR